jgi:Concanavalin A-like lectin/glucanases superfamily/FG-GAP repeat
LVFVQVAGSPNKAYLYVDGVLRASQDMPPTLPTPSGALQVGRRMNAGSFGAYLDGQVRDVRLYGYALSGAQVTNLYNEGKDGIDVPAPQQLGVSPCTGTGCPPLGFTAVTSLQRPDLTAVMAARPGSKWNLQFLVIKQGASTPAETGTVRQVEAGKVASWQPSVYLDNNTDWIFRVRTRSSADYAWGPWSYDFGFRVDVPAPAVPVITSADFKNRAWGNPDSGTFSWRSASPEVDAYSWQLDNGVWSAWAGDTTAKLDKLPAEWHYFHVKARNHAGLESAVASYGFGVGPEPLAFPDLNGDGAADVITATSARLAQAGDPLLGPGEAGGSAEIIPGGDTLPGLRPALLPEDVPGLPAGEAGDDFGASLVYGDFTGDGQTDLAIGVPGREVGGHDQAGEVIVLYGQKDWPYVKTGTESVFNSDIVKLPGGAQDGDEFGISLAAARFRGSGYTGLAIGVPGHTVEGRARAGMVVLLKGSPDGLTTTGEQTLTAAPWAGQGLGPVTEGRFGWSVTAADVTGTSSADLAVLALGPGLSVASSGTVYLVHGEFQTDLVPVTGDGGSLTAAQAGVTGHLRQVAAGWFAGHGTGHEDLVIAADQRPDTADWSGTLVQVTGTDAGMDRHTGIMSLVPPGRPGVGFDGFFGGALAAGPLEEGADYDDLAVGELGAGRYAGAVTVLSGGSDGIFSRPPLTFTAADPVIGAPADAYDGFGYGLAIQPTGKADPADPAATARLLVTAPQLAGDPAAGSLYVLTVTPAAKTTGPRLSAASSYTARQLGALSLFGPGWPLAGGTTIGTDIDEVPQRDPIATRGQHTTGTQH